MSPPTDDVYDPELHSTDAAGGFRFTLVNAAVAFAVGVCIGLCLSVYL